MVGSDPLETNQLITENLTWMNYRRSVMRQWKRKSFLIHWRRIWKKKSNYTLILAIAILQRERTPRKWTRLLVRVRQLSLARKALHDWVEQRPTALVTTTLIWLTDDEFSYQEKFPISWLRVVLLPNEIYDQEAPYFLFAREGRCWEGIRQVHFIDNFDLRYQKNPDGSISSAQISFLLPQNHGLEKTHSGIIVNLQVDRIVCFLGSIGHMCPQKYRKPFPISSSSSPITKWLMVPEGFRTQLLLYWN